MLRYLIFNVIPALVLISGAIMLVWEGGRLSSTGYSQRTSERNKIIATRIAAAIIALAGVGMLVWPFVEGVQGELRRKAADQAIARGEHREWIDTLVGRARESAGLKAFSYDGEDFTYVFYSPDTLDSVYVEFKGAYYEEAPPERVADAVVEMAEKMWKMPEHVTAPGDVVFMDECDLHDQEILDARPAPKLAEAEESLERAGKAWDAGDPDLANAFAFEAYWIRKERLGEDHPQTQAVKQMLDSAGARY